jgi:membrane protease YdiL (CAAX protease family)
VPRRDLAPAALLAAVIVVVEYVARHVVAPALPVLASPLVDDMVVTGAAYVALSLAVARVLGASPPAKALRGFVVAMTRWQGWVGIAAALAALVLGSFFDRGLWGGVHLPSFQLPPSAVFFGAGLTWLGPVSLLVVNGVVVPVAEEWLWRGAVQPRFVSALGVRAGIAVTAVLFSVKHAMVDASLGRLAAIVGAGLVLGWVARRASWQASAISHIGMNTMATTAVLATQWLVPTCAATPPALSPELQRGVDTAVTLVNDPDPAAIDASLVPAFSRPEMKDFFAKVQTTSGRCRWQCATETPGPRQVTGILSCEKVSDVMTVGVEAAAPHRIDYLLIRPTLVAAPAVK